MSDSSSWSLPLGRWMRVHVRVHALFLVVTVFTLFLATRGPDTGAPHAAIAIGVLLASVLLHEWGHALAAIRVGGSAETLLIGPLGGLRFVEVPREPHAELIASLAGPLVNLGILLAVLPVLLLSGVAVPGLLNPLEPAELMQGPLGIVALKLTLWINWLILLANLLPAFPFDGARMLRAMLRPALDERGATLVAVRASKLTALGLCVWAWLASDSATGTALPSWVPILSLAILVYFSAAQEAGRGEPREWDEDLLSYDFSQGYTSLERSTESPQQTGGVVQRWLNSRRDLRRRRRESREQDEERQVDDILVRLHERGMSGLTPDERALLQRVSARYRNRQSN